MKNIAILCSGGDVSGMNAALKRFVELSFSKGLMPYFINSGYEGLIDNQIRKATYSDVVGIISRGGTIIHSSRSQRFLNKEYRKKAIANLTAHQIAYVIVLGGEGSFKGMQKLRDESSGIHFSGIPATIDNDIAGTEYCLGVDTALGIIKYAIDSVRDTASSFNRAFVIETMGRECGYLALASSLTSGAEMCLIPEIPYRLEQYKERFQSELVRGRKYFIAIVCEALNNTEQIATWFTKEVGIESRTIVLGHTQRGGNTSVHDRLMALHFVTYAIDSLLAENTCSVICYNAGGFSSKGIDEVAHQSYRIDPTLLAFGREFESIR